MKGFKRREEEGEKNPPYRGGNDDLCRPFVPLGMAAPADVVLHQEGGQADLRLEVAGSRQGRRGDTRAGARDRRSKDERSELRHHRSGHEDGRGLSPFDGRRGGGVTVMAIGKRLKKAREGVDREKLYPLADPIKKLRERSQPQFAHTAE